MGLGELTSRGDDAVLQSAGMLCCSGWDSSKLINSLWDWWSGLQDGRMLYSNGVACCVVVGGIVFVFI